MLRLSDSNKTHLSFLTNLTENVLADFCKLSWDFICKGPNLKLYNSAAQKLNVAVQDIQHVVEALANLLIEACKRKISQPKLIDSLKQFGFSDSCCNVLCQFYRAKRTGINHVLLAAAIQLPTFKDLDWRVEAQVGSRSVPHQITPSVLMKLSLDDAGSNSGGGTLMQADANTLMHISWRLEEALAQATAPHTTRVQRRFRQT